MGGDEVQFDCWKSNPNISAFMAHMRYGQDYAKLQAYYTGRVLDHVLSALDLRPIVWEEVFENDAGLDKRAVVDVWKGSWKDVLAQVTRAGNPAILSACWYYTVLLPIVNIPNRVYYVRVSPKLICIMFSVCSKDCARNNITVS